MDLNNLDGFYGCFNKGFDCDSCKNNQYTWDRITCKMQKFGKECRFEEDTDVYNCDACEHKECFDCPGTPMFNDD